MGALLDCDRAAAILFDAAMFGDGEAARRNGITKRTVRRYRAELRTNDALSSAFRALVDEAEGDLGALRVKFLRKALLELERRLDREDTTVEAIAEAVRVVGEMHQVASVVEDDEGAGSDPETAEAQGGDAGAAHVAH